MMTENASSPEIRLLTLWEPYASLVALGIKPWETRPRYSGYRGWVAIHAGRRIPSLEQMRTISLGMPEDAMFSHPDRLSGHPVSLAAELGRGEGSLFNLKKRKGCIVAIARLTHCLYMVANSGDPPPRSHRDTIVISSMSPLDIATGNWQVGRYALRLENVTALPAPIPARGYQGLIRIHDEATLRRLSPLMKEVKVG